MLACSYLIQIAHLTLEILIRYKIIIFFVLFNYQIKYCVFQKFFRLIYKVKLYYTKLIFLTEKVNKKLYEKIL